MARRVPCGGTTPHGPHEWFGSPATLRGECPGVPADAPLSFADLQRAQGTTGRVDPEGLAMELTDEERGGFVQQPGDEMLTHYSAALDEIYRLRCALVYEARITEAHLQLLSFPRSRRYIAEQQIERMRAAARGETEDAYAELSSGTAQGLLVVAGASGTLTRGQWEADHAG